MSENQLQLPEYSCDSHVHIYGPLEKYPPPAHSQYSIPDVGLDELLAMHDLNGISRAVLVNAAAASPDNQRMLDALNQFPDRLRGIASKPVNDLSNKQLREWDQQGVRGIRVSFVGKDVSSLDRALICQIADLGWHLQIQVENNQILELESAVREIPCDVVIDHMGRIPATGGVAGEAFQCLLRMLTLGKVWVKLSAPMRYSGEANPPYNDVKPMAQALVNQNPDKVLWGSDWPHVNYSGKIPAFHELLLALDAWLPDPKIQKKILVDNPGALYSFSGV